MLWLWILLSVLLAAGAGYLTWRADVKRAVPYPWLPSLLRSLVVLLTLLLLLAPGFTITKNETLKPIVLFVQDDSRSVGDALDKDSTNYKADVNTLLGKLEDKYRVVTWNLSGNTAKDSLHLYNNETTDLATTLDKVQEYYGTQNLGAVVLASDGKYNRGVSPLNTQLSMRGALYTVGIGDTTLQKDIRIARVYANKTVAANNSFEIRADIVAQKSSGYSNSLRVTEGGNILATAPVKINSDQYDRTVSITIKAGKPGIHHYVLNIPEADGEANIYNNRRDVFIEVTDEQKHILIAAAAPHPDINAIKEALKGIESYKITTRVNNDFPNLLEEYDILILHQLPGQGYKMNPTIIRSAKPSWFFVGSKTDNNAFASMDKPLAVNITPYTGSNVFPVYNTSFNAYGLPQNIREVMARMPPVFVPAGMLKAEPSAQVLFTGKGTDVPLWALKKGKTSTAITTGDGLWRWRMYEYKNYGNTNVIDECIRQTVAFLAADESGKGFRVTLPKYVWSDRESISMNAYLYNANYEPVNTPDVQLVITDSSGERTNYTFERSGNNYQLNIGVRSGGTYSYTASSSYNGKALTETGSFVVEDIPLELMESGADYDMLYTLADNNGGAFFPATDVASVYDSIAANEQIKPVIETNIETVPLIDRKWFFFLILLVAVAEWLLRKYWLAQ